jgi:thiamine pyrophosphate-dependent acetolactate synthase large subunit-like protein
MGQYGNAFADAQMKEADVILALGSRFSDVSTREWTLIPKGARIIHVDIDPKELGRQYSEEISMVGDVKLFLQAALAELKNSDRAKPFRGQLEEHPRIAALLQQREADRKAFFDPSAHASVPGRPHLLVKEIIDTLRPDAIISLGAGLYARFAGKIRVQAPRSYLKSLGLGALGWAFPAAMGAKLGEPARQVVSLLGDGDFMTVMQDLETAVRENIAVTVVVFNDRGHGSIRELQKREYNGRVVGADHMMPPFHEIARLMGGLGERVSRPEEIKPALSQLLNSGRPSVLDIAIDLR